MKTKLATLLLLSLIATSAHAGPKHRFYRDKSWWAGEAVILLAVGADYKTTSGFLARCPRCTETNPILGSHPSTRRIVGVGISAAAGYTVLHAASYHFSHNDPNRVWRFAGRWDIPVIVGTLHGKAAANNAQLQPHLH